MKHVIPILFAASLLLTGGGCRRASTPTPDSITSAPAHATASPMQTEDLRTFFEQEYERVRLLAEQSTPDAFFAVIDPESLDEQSRSEMRASWAMASQIMKDMMPSLNDPNVKFIKIVQNDTWAGYYFAYKTHDDITMLAVRRFHKTGDTWKVGTFSATSISGNTYTSLNPAEIETAIAESSVMGPVPPAKK